MEGWRERGLKGLNLKGIKRWRGLSPCICLERQIKYGSDETRERCTYTGVQLCWYTAVLVHSCAGTQLYWYITVLVHSCAGTQLCWYTAVLVHSCAGTQPCWYTAVLVHNCAGTQLH